MNNSKKILAIAASVAMLGSLAACGNSGSSSSGSGSNEDVKLLVWTPQEDQKAGWIQDQEKAFEKAHPEYKITWTNKVVSEGDTGTTVKKDPAAAADVYLFANDQLGMLVEANAIGELSDSAAEQVKADNDEAMVQSVTNDGKLYGVPFTGNTWFMYYNKSKLSDADVKNFNTMMDKAKVSFSIDNSWYLPAFYYANGGTLYGPDGTDASGGAQFGGEQGAAVTKFLAENIAAGKIIDDVDGSGLAGLSNGSVDVIFSGTWDAENVKKALGDNYAAAQLPTVTIDGKEQQMKSFAGSKAVAYNPNSKFQKVAAQFAAFLGSKEAQLAHYEKRGVVPTIKSLLDNDKVKNDIAAQAQAATIANTAVLQPTITEMSNFWDPTQAFGKALVQKDVTPDNAAEKTEAWVAQLNKQ